MAKFDYIVDIDPDVEKSGVAVLDVAARKYIIIDSMPFPQVCECFKDCLAFLDNKRMKVVIEAGWMVRKSNFHQAQGHRAERVAKNVGENHGTGKQLFAMAEHYGLNVECVHPLKKCWKGKDGKITHDELAAFTHIEMKRTNQDARDAALLAWCHADLPIRVAVSAIFSK